MHPNRPALPPSATNLATSILGVACAFGLIAYLRITTPDIDPMFAAVFIMLAAALPTVISDLFIERRYRDPAAGFSSRRPLALRLLMRKCFGLVVTFIGIGVLYWLFPEYEQPLYKQYFNLVAISLPLLLVLTPFYFAWCITHADNVHDAYDEIALLAMGKLRGRDWAEIGRHARNWLVKAFFLPLMVAYTINSTRGLLDLSIDWSSFRSIYLSSHSIIMFMDLLYASIGYVLTLRILNSHIRSSDPTFRGWVVAVACYAPFWEVLLYARFFNYSDTLQWQEWLAGYPVISVVWGCSILALLAIYSLATVCLGIRFSNLTYRGLIASGPYRFTKHPAYVTKNLSWWLVSVPFITTGHWSDAVAHCALLLFVNLIYYLRAVTEEQHLSNYPEYRAYALAMNQRSVFRPLVKYLPFLEYKVPERLPRI